MRIEGLKKFRGRNPRGYFEGLPWEVRNRAYMWLHKFCQRWGNDLPRWRFAILVGQAKRLALNPPTSGWGRSMLAKRGGYAVQLHYQLEGRNPTAPATRARLLKQAHGKQAAEDTQRRATLGLPPKRRR
jgi:hypothetical protein